MDKVCILSWNIRGLGRLGNRSNLKEFIMKWKPNIVCLQEIISSNLDNFVLRELWNGDKIQFLFQVPSSQGTLVDYFYVGKKRFLI